jgi:hypothetical protein
MCPLSDWRVFRQLLKLGQPEGIRSIESWLAGGTAPLQNLPTLPFRLILVLVQTETISRALGLHSQQSNRRDVRTKTAFG